MGNVSVIQVQIVKGGFILESMGETGQETEVFISQGKLLKAIRLAVEANALVGKTKDDAEPAAD